jgi:pSer/pThr/pTyr-binding forkhead associated (FHA) protein
MLISEQRPAPVFAWLVVVEGPDPKAIGQVQSLQPVTSNIGRAPGNHIVIHDDTCSGQHARIRVEGEEGGEPAFVLYDMGSRNGTYVGDRATYKDEENRQYRHELQDGDYLLIGETTLAFKKL